MIGKLGQWEKIERRLFETKTILNTLKHRVTGRIDILNKKIATSDHSSCPRGPRSLQVMKGYQQSFLYLFFPPTGHIAHLGKELLLLSSSRLPLEGSQSPRSWWTQVGPTASETGGTGNRTRDPRPTDRWLI